MILWLALLGCADRDGDGTRAGRDCDDSNPEVHLDAVEICDGIDNDCDGQVDEDVAILAFLDRDGDGYGLSSAARRVCELPANGATTGGDCDDTTAALNPSVVERCDGIDNDCDGQIDEDLTSLWFRDLDGDGAGTGRPQEDSRACEPPDGYAATDDDCDDHDPSVYIGAAEACDGRDNDCDGQIDEDLPARRVWLDADGDGVGGAASPGVACGAVDVWSLTNDDCDDADADVYPGGTELLGNPIDDDCDGFVDERSIPHDYPTIDAAWRDAPDGSIVQLEPGRTVGTWGLRDRDLTLAGSGCDRTVLDGALAGSVLVMEGGRLAGLTIENGTGTENVLDNERDGGGLLVRGGQVEVDSVCFTRNGVSGRGGALAVRQGGSVVVSDSRFIDNRASGQGGAIWGDRADVVIERSHFERNHAMYAGALMMDAGDLVVDQSRFLDNSSVRLATTVGLQPQGFSTSTVGDAPHASPGTAAVTNSLFARNRSPDRPAVFRHFLDELTVEGTVFADNDGVVFQNVRSLRWHDNAYVGQDDTTPGIWDSQGLREPAELFGEGWLLADNPIVVAGIGPDHDLQRLQDDADRDGLPDGWSQRFGVRPEDSASSDPDGDGLSHDLERGLGTDPHRADTDGDGVDDGLEALDADPLDPLDQHPLVDAGPDLMALVGQSIELQATAVHPRARPLTTVWRVTDSPASSAFNVTSTHFSAEVAGTYVLTVEVDDGLATVQDSRTVDVRDGVVVPDDHPDLETALAAIQNGQAVGLRPGVWSVSSNLGITRPARTDVVVFGLGAPDQTTLVPSEPGPVIALRDRDLHLANLTVTGGIHADSGGGLQIRDGDLTLERVRVVGNRSDTDGGGIAVLSGTLTTRDSQVIDNRANHGGGMYVVGSIDLRRTTIESNHADTVSGVRLIVPSTNTTLADPSVQGCVFAFNEGGGAVFDLETSQLRDATVSNTVFWDNDAEHGVHTAALPILAVDDLFENNRFSDGTTAQPAWVIESTSAFDALGLQLDSGPVHTLPLNVRSSPADLRPARAVRGSLTNVWTPRLGSSVVNAGWVRHHDADGTRSDHARRSDVPLDGRWRLDVDGDGLSDGWEDHFGLDPHHDDSLEDPDGDGRTSLQEHTAGTDPTAADTDADGVDDSHDVLPLDPRNHTPVAQIERLASGTTVGESFGFSGASSADPDGTALTYAWRITRSPEGRLSGPSSDTFTFTPLLDGVYEIELVVESDGVRSLPTTLSVDVRPTLELLDGESLSAAFTLPSGSRVLLGDGDFPVEGTLPRDLIVEGQGLTTRIRGHAELPTGQVDLRNLVWSSGVADRGGAIDCDDAQIDATNVVFSHNHARIGGAVSMNNCSGRWTDVRFEHNAALESGGGLYAQRGTLTMVRGGFTSNEAGHHGGGARFANQPADLRNVTFFRNSAGLRGGGMAHAGSGALSGSHLTMAGNTTGDTYSQLTLGAAGTLSNSVLIGAQPLRDGLVVPTTTTELHDTSWSPAFANYPPLGGEQADLHPLAGGPLVDSGSGRDADGTPADRGAFGGPDAPTDGDRWIRDRDGDGLVDGFEQYWSLSDDDDPDNDGLSNSQEMAYGTSPLLADTDGDGVPDRDEVDYGSDPRVNENRAPGLLFDRSVVDPRDSIVVTATGGTRPYAWSLVHAPPRSVLPLGVVSPRPTVTLPLDVPGRYRLRVRDSEGGDTHVDFFARGPLSVPGDLPDLGAALEDIAPASTITLAPGRYDGPFLVERPVTIAGVGATLHGHQETTPMTVRADSVTLVGLELVGGRGTLGGALRVEGDELRLDGVTVRDSQAVHGGGVYVRSGRVDVTGSSLVDNQAALDGGGLWSSGDSFLGDVQIAGNRAGRAGGGGLQVGGSLALDAALVVDNRAASGGGWTLDRTVTDLQYCTFGHNRGEPSALELISGGSLSADACLFVAVPTFPLLDVELGITTVFDGGGFFDVDLALEPFPLSPLDPVFDFGVLTDDRDWTNDAWGRFTTPSPGPGAFGSP